MEAMINEEYYRVYFCTNDSDREKVIYPAILISRFKDNWNDFTYKIKCRYQVFKFDGEELYSGPVYLGFSSNVDDALTDDPFGLDSELAIPEEKVSQYFSIQGGMDSYRRIVKNIGVSEAIAVLNSINDLVSSSQLSPVPIWLSKVEETEVFRLAFMREGNRFFAYHNAGSILKGLKKETLKGISTKLKLRYKLDSFKGLQEIDFSFDQDGILPKRMMVLIGENGLGKSEALSNIISSLKKGNDHLVDEVGNRPLINRVIAIATPGETANTFPAESQDFQIDYRRLVTARGANSSKSRGFGEVCVQLFRSAEIENGIKGRDRWDVFIDLLKSIKDHRQICLQTSGPAPKVDFERGLFPIIELDELSSEQRKLEILASLNNNKQPMRLVNGNMHPLSSGQLSLLKFAAQACLNIENGSLILLDEPETHLHPSYISEYISLLDYLLKETGSLAIIATHSPYLVREMPRSQVRVFKLREGRIVDILEPRLKTFGADIDSISHFVFEDAIMNRLGENLIEELVKSKDTKSFDRLLGDLKEELPVEMMMYINHRLGEEN